MMTRARTEQLEIVFTLSKASESVAMSLPTAQVKFQPRTGSITPPDALRLLVERMHAFGIDGTFVENGKEISSATLLKKIEKKGTWGRLETAELSFQFGVVGSFEHCFISIREKNPLAAGDWERWMIPFLSLDGFVQGWVADVEYNHWQNAKDPAEYEIVGRDFAHLPMKSNGLPPPVERMEIDTSGNPGRRLLRSGYVEAIGAVMWLSELFWDRVGRDHKILAGSAKWLRADELPNGIVKIRLSEECFVSEETAALQNRLREILYC